MLVTRARPGYGAYPSRASAGAPGWGISGHASVGAASATGTLLGRTTNLVGSGSAPPRSRGAAVQLSDLEADGPKPPIAIHGALFGADVNYDRSEPKTTQITNLETDLGRTLDVDGVYADWAGSFPGPVQRADEQAGRIPLISWGCTNVTQIIDGAQDSFIRQKADAIKAFGYPIYLRWYWEMNLPGNQACLDGMGPSGYVLAWRHIWTVFAQQGVANAAWVWCPGSGQDNPSSLAAYYPGDGYVDYVCADGYSRNPPHTFGQIFGSFYSQWSSHKPMMVGETGSLAGTSAQADWITNTDQEVAASFPDIKVFIYFDSTGTYDYTVTAPASVAALAALVRSTYFNPAARPLRPEGRIVLTDDS